MLPAVAGRAPPESTEAELGLEALDEKLSAHGIEVVDEQLLPTNTVRRKPAAVSRRLRRHVDAIERMSSHVRATHPPSLSSPAHTGHGAGGARCDVVVREEACVRLSLYVQLYVPPEGWLG